MTTNNTITSDINPLYRLPTVTQVTGKPRSTLYRNIQAGLFTKPVQIGGSRVAWPKNEVAAINQARIAGKSDDQIRELVSKLEADRQNPHS